MIYRHDTLCRIVFPLVVCMMWSCSHSKKSPHPELPPSECYGPLSSHSGGPYYGFCENPITLNGNESCPKNEIANIEWALHGPVTVISRKDILTPTVQWECGEDRQIYIIILTIWNHEGTKAQHTTWIELDTGLL